MRVYWPKPVMLDGSWGATTGKNGQLKATFYMSLHPARERYRDTATCKWGSL